mmetsp:Transcript_55323/g.134366  ORF Transcript_55323/g.134366 Transcript_55323/m.134366 type:complete len:675 (+) Transcript_55323:147-2171(+)
MTAVTMVRSLVVALVVSAVMPLTMGSASAKLDDAQRQRRQQNTNATTSTSTPSTSATSTSTILPGDALWLGDYGDGDGTPDINDYFPITYTVFGDGGVAIPRIVVPLDQGCPKVKYVQVGQESVAVVQVKLRVQGDFNLPHAFPVTVCEVRLERDAQKQGWSLGRIFFEGTDPSNNLVIPTDPKNVLIYGDTGLRIKPKNLGLGNCEDSPYSVYGVKQCPFNFTEADVNLTEVDGDFQPLQNWHFDDMLKVAADQHDDLDLAIHVGDYVYRQGPCPTQLDLNGDCVGINGPTSFTLNDLNGTTINFEPGNWGDNLFGWWSDFFYPARSMLQKVPFIAMRGNHETCDRAGYGFFFFLDPGEYNSTEPGAEYCVDYTDPFAVPFKHEQYIVQDSSDVDEKDGGIDHFNFVPDACPNPPADGSLIQVSGANRFDAVNPSQTNESIFDQVALYEAEMIKMGEMAKRHETNIILTHRPLFAVGCNDTQMVALDWTLERTVSTDILYNVSGVISGHMHWLEVVEFEDGVLPSQIVVGHGGTKLIPNYVNQEIFPSLQLIVGYKDEIEAKVSKGFSNSTSFGYGVMVKNTAGDFLTTFFNYDQTSNSTDTLEYPLVIPKTRHNRSGNASGSGSVDSSSESENSNNSSGSEIGDSSESESSRKIERLCTATTIVIVILFANA